MPRVIRVGLDDAQYHGYLPLGKVFSGSNKVITNGASTARQTDPYTPEVHCVVPPGSPCHTIGTATQGSPDVFVEGLPVHRDGDRVECGTVADNGSPNVYANGSSGGSTAFLGDDDGGEEGFDFIGYVPGTPIVEYLSEDLNPIVVCSGSFEITPFDGSQHSGYVNLHKENNSNPNDIGELVGRTYPGIGLYPPDPDIPEDIAPPPPVIKYELSSSPINASIDVNTGVITGYWAYAGTLNVRVSHFYYDDITSPDLPGTQGPWWSIPIVDCDGAFS